ncbi:hypothetical protein IAD21_00486 [Abditibacteriota bacterium]|nr:hypothetical protein IAD21_00486 [Abditibacteriota bacterium]
MKRGWQYEQVRRDEQTRQNMAEQRKQNMTNCGCFAIYSVVMLGAFVFMASGITLGVAPDITPSWPLSAQWSRLLP